MGSPDVGSGNNGMVARECTRKRPSASPFACAISARLGVLLGATCGPPALLRSRDVGQAAHDAAAEHGQQLALENASSRGAAPHGKMTANRLSTLQLSDARAG